MIQGFFDNVNREYVEQFKTQRNETIGIELGGILYLSMGGGFEKNHSGETNFIDFYQHLDKAKELFLITYNIEKQILQKENILKKVWNLNEARGWKRESVIIPGVITGFEEFHHDCSHLKKTDEPCNYERRRMECAEIIDKWLPEGLRAFINVMSSNVPEGDPRGFHFYINMHAKVYFTEQMAYIGSANPNWGLKSPNGESGVITQDKEVIEFLKAFYIAVKEEAVPLDLVTMPESKKHLIRRIT